MAFKLLAVCLAFALAASAQDLSSVKSSLDTQVNQLCDEYLGIPCKNSPPPPGSPPPAPVSPPPPAPVVPPTEPPSVPPTAPPTAPPTVPPAVAPTPAPVPAPVPAPAPANGVALGAITLTTNDGVVLSAAQLAELTALLGANDGGEGVVTQGVTGRKLLASTTFPFTVTGVTNCEALVAALDEYVQSGEFVTEANEEGIPLTGATLSSLQCSGAGTSSAFNALSPTPAPGPGPAEAPAPFR